MRKRKNVISENYLERVPVRLESIGWSKNEEGIVTLEIENTGWANRIAQKLFKRPKISYVHLDKHGSFVWPLIDGKSNIIELGKLVDEQFGEEAKPLYERLATFFKILDSYHFIKWADKK
ncbi:MAG: PqqD family protein [Ruminococcaceae bacterium]|nr:PqqD family protein [Oscillospiraceae bacterium]